MRIKILSCSMLFLLALALAGPAFADESLGTLTPREVFVGERAVFSYIEENLPLSRLFGENEPGAALEVPRELIPADSADVAIKGARLIPLQGREDAALFEIEFVPWKTGLVSIPEIAFAPGISRRSRAVKIEVASLAARFGAASLMPNRPPILPPGTLYLLYALVLAVAGICAAAFLAARKALELRRDLGRIPIKRIRREFKKLIKVQRLRIGKNEPGWYAELAGLARLFFYRMTGCSRCLAATARDMERLLERPADSRTDGEAAAAKRLVAALFQIEKIRFAGEGCAKGDSEERALKSYYMEAFEEFVALACASASSFFGAVAEEAPTLAKSAAAALGKKDKGRAVV